MAWADEVDDRVTAEQLAGRVREMLDDLPDAQRQVLILRDIEGVEAGEVAMLVGNVRRQPAGAAASGPLPAEGSARARDGNYGMLKLFSVVACTAATRSR